MSTPIKGIILFLISCISFIAQSQPNIIIFLTDDQGWNGSSVQMLAGNNASKSDYYQTPNLELLAQRGMIFSQAYAPAPKCAPTRCSVLTGKSTARNHFTNTSSNVATGEKLIEPSSIVSIPSTDTTLAEWLKLLPNANYTTAHFGKWHLRTDGTAAHGFDVGDGNTSNNDGNNIQAINDDPKKIFSLTQSAIQFIEDAVAGEQPFYLQLSHYAVHTQIESLRSTLDLYNDQDQRPSGSIHQNASFGAMTEDLDTGLGQLMATLDNLNLWDNTYFFFLSDNGGASRMSPNTPLKAGKVFLDEGGIRIPWIVAGPGINGNSYQKEPVIGYDLFPTIAALITENTDNLPSSLDGQSIVPLLLGETPFQRKAPLFFHSPHYDMGPSKKPRSAIVKDSFKLLVNYETGEFNLYNLASDLGENNDLFTTLPNQAMSLWIALRDHLKEVDAQMPQLDPNAPDFNGVFPDVDEDGLEDAWEFRELLSTKFGPQDDPDQDGKNNQTEYENGTDPLVDETISSIIPDNFYTNQIRLFPNPTAKGIYLQFDTTNLPTVSTLIQLFDPSGRLVKEQSIDLRHQTQIYIPLHHFVPGTYSIHINARGIQVNKQLIIH